MSLTESWYAVYTKPQWEKRVAAVLTQKGFENYCPFCTVPQRGSERKKLVEEPLFPSHVFVFATLKEFAIIRKTEGIINLVYWLDKPAVLREEEIIAIKNFLAEHKEIGLEKIRINRIERTQILQDPLLHKEETMPEVFYKTIRVLLPTLCYALVAKVNTSNEERNSMIEASGVVQKNNVTSRA